jgi:NTE family protein
MAFGIALSGGGTRGAAHVGVLCALEEAGMMPRSISGTSAGSIVAGLYALGFSCRELRGIVADLSKNGVKVIDADYWGLLKSLFQFFTHEPITFSGLIKGDKLEKYLCKLTKGKSIRDVKMKTIITAVDLSRGQTIAYINSLERVKPIDSVLWKTDIKLCTAMRASCAVPAVFQPKKINKLCLVDGGVTDVLPVDLLIAAGEDNVLAVDLAKEYHDPGCDNIIEISSHSLTVMSRRLSELVASGEKLTINPTLPKNAGLLTFKYMNRCMDAGYEATKALMPTIKKIFS